MTKYVIKASGEKEPFSLEKFTTSLKKAGASQDVIQKLAEEIKERPDLKTTKEIYNFANQHLQKEDRAVAARYNLKQALYDFGPTGYPFEYFVGELLRSKGYRVEVGEILKGFCVNHEIDVCAHKDDHIMVECKFHNRPGLKTDVKVSLYVQARFLDLQKEWQQYPKHTHELQYPWLITNTKFTTDVIQYGTCVNMKLTSWNYPQQHNLAQWIDESGLHPITCLTSLTTQQKKELMQKGFVLCKDVDKHKQHLKALEIPETALEDIIAEAHGVCQL